MLHQDFRRLVLARAGLADTASARPHDNSAEPAAAARTPERDDGASAAEP